MVEACSKLRVESIYKAWDSVSISTNSVISVAELEMIALPSSDMSVIWIDIWDSQKSSRDKTLINYSFNFWYHTTTVQKTAIYSGVT